MFAFLLVVPFNTRFSRLTSFDRTNYFVTLLPVAVSAFLLLGPVIHHRLLFRHHEKAFLVVVANRLIILAMGSWRWPSPASLCCKRAREPRP
jgi:hypothetical protein